MYTILAQRYRGKTTYYGQLERIDQDADGAGWFTTLFKCWHRHRTMDGAQHCPDVTAVRNADLEAQLMDEAESRS
jgi:hypothetical protein